MDVKVCPHPILPLCWAKDAVHRDLAVNEPLSPYAASKRLVNLWRTVITNFIG